MKFIFDSVYAVPSAESFLARDFLSYRTGMIIETISERGESDARQQASVRKRVLISQALISFGETKRERGGEGREGDTHTCMRTNTQRLTRRHAASDPSRQFAALVLTPDDKMTKGLVAPGQRYYRYRFGTMRTVVRPSHRRPRITAENVS